MRTCPTERLRWKGYQQATMQTKRLRKNRRTTNYMKTPLPKRHATALSTAACCSMLQPCESSSACYGFCMLLVDHVYPSLNMPSTTLQLAHKPCRWYRLRGRPQAEHVTDAMRSALWGGEPINCTPTKSTFQGNASTTWHDTAGQRAQPGSMHSIDNPPCTVEC